MSRRYATLYERLVANSRLDDDTLCWVWTGATRAKYGVFTERVEGMPHPTRRAAHRAMLEETTGYEFPYDEGGHICRNTLCIAPYHLRVQTTAENLSDRIGYAPCNGRWIPVLFPTEKKQREDRLNTFLDLFFAGKTGVLHAPGEPCPF